MMNPRLLRPITDGLVGPIDGGGPLFLGPVVDGGMFNQFGSFVIDGGTP